MSQPDPVCTHSHTTCQEWDYGRDPETGYRDAGITVTCLDCSEIFTADEFQRHLDDHERDRNPEPGDVYTQLGMRLVVVEADGAQIHFVCRNTGIHSSPLLTTSLEAFQLQLRRGLVTRVRDPR